MKKMLLLGLVTASMVSCSNNEVFEVNEVKSRSINFESFVNKPTRADVELTSLKEFYVFGYYGTNTTVFDNVSVVGSQTNSTTGSWTVGEEEVWDTQNYYFAAYANGNGDGISGGEDKLTDTDVDFAGQVLTISNYDTDGTKDLVATKTAINRDNTTNFDDSSVDLTFSHLLSRIAITFKNTSTSVFSVDISDIKLTVKNGATYNTTNKWNLTGATSKVYNITNVTLAQNASSSETVFYLTPQQLAETETISFTAIFKDGAGSEVEVVGGNNYTIKLNKGKNSSDSNVAEWELGVAYNYTINLPSTPMTINFNVYGVESWGTATGITISGREDRN